MGFLQKLLQKLSAANKEEHGNKRLDCCDLNKAQNKAPRNNKG
jgi:hypothetical protein